MREHTGMPVPMRERELQATHHSPVISYKLRPEELEEYRRKTGYTPKEENAMKQLTREQYLQMRLAGKSRSEIMRENYPHSQAFYKQLKEWGIKEKDAEERAMELMTVPSITSKNVDREVTSSAVEASEIAPITDYQRAIINNLTSIEDLFKNIFKNIGINNAIQAVIDERRRQDDKWGQQDHEPMAWMGILGEEFGELCEAVNETHFNNGLEERAKGGYENMRREAVQVAAVAVSFVEMLDRRYA